MWQEKTAEQILSKLESNAAGLSSDEAEKRIELYGKNKLADKKEKSLLMRFIEQFNDYMVIILLIAATISFCVSVLSGDADYFDPIIILLIVMLNAMIGVFQESKAKKSLDALKKMSTPTVLVMRDGKKLVIKSEDLVCGDIIYIKAGDLVPADARLIESHELCCDESPLTGESEPARKDADVILDSKAGVSDAKNMVFSSCRVVSGYGTGVVVETGMNSQVGKIATMLIDGGEAYTPLQEKLARTGKTLGIMAIGICAVIFAMGLVRKMPLFDMLMTSISLAVAAIPEGLVAIVTIMLALGVQRMADKNAIVKKLPAVETLGSASVICSDKTGTLTQNKMKVTRVYGNRSFVLDIASLCNNNSDPTERAITEAAVSDGCDVKRIAKKYLRVREVGFDSKKKYMATVHRRENGYRIIVKGAPDVVMSMCVMSDNMRKRAERENIDMAHDALRVIAIAYKDCENMGESEKSGLNFAGLIGIIDPPRPEVKEAVAMCRSAGIKPVMITGDHIETAKAIGAQTGIFTDSDRAMSADELSRLSDDELAVRVDEYSVFARVSPEHKVRIVNAFKRRGEVVAMTGDGVNDAPALKAADIGCAMGISGTDVCREASDIVLCDDNFATIVSAVKEGRVIYANIKKAVHFLLSSNIGEIITIFFAILIGWPAPLEAIHLLWVNFITDSLPAIALGFEKADEGIMRQNPISRRKSLFADGMGTSIFFEGIMIATLSLLAFSFGRYIWQDEKIAQTMAFCVLCLSQLVHAFNMRSGESVFQIGLLSNRVMNMAFIICCALQLMVICISPISRMFKAVMLSPVQWIIVATLSFMPLLIIESEKLFSKKAKNEQEKKKQKRASGRILFEK